MIRTKELVVSEIDVIEKKFRRPDASVDLMQMSKIDANLFIQWRLLRDELRSLKGSEKKAVSAAP